MVKDVVRGNAGDESAWVSKLHPGFEMLYQDWTRNAVVRVTERIEEDFPEGNGRIKAVFEVVKALFNRSYRVVQVDQFFQTLQGNRNGFMPINPVNVFGNGLIGIFVKKFQ